ncbi:helix-turn-helix domain-containing protein [uncultured Sphingomonas sp.]|uniref:AraC family transcriptional regulator n=1 Tax=uncultured Sphingomonas sp. TaxID=158754 RepID=UPI0025E63C48|nr:helix-turn-helix domain-containing protein [uncultured Sphingomonas sp.]
MELKRAIEGAARAAAAAADETWHLSRRPLARGTTAFIGQTLRDAGTVGEAARRIAHAYNVVHAGHYNRVDLRPDRFIYVVDDRQFPYGDDVTPATAFEAMALVLVLVHTMLSLVAGRDLRPSLRAVHARSPGRDEGEIARFWAAPIRHNASVWRLDYRIETADLPVAPRFEGFGQAEVFAEAIALADADPAGRDIAARVRAAIDAGAEDQAAVARRLGLSPATLRRRLDQAGTSFRDIRADALNDAARRMLAAAHPSADIAQALGFADGRSFARAFKAWNGVSPGQYRAAPPPPLSEDVPSV